MTKIKTWVINQVTWATADAAVNPVNLVSPANPDKVDPDRGSTLAASLVLKVETGETAAAARATPVTVETAVATVNQEISTPETSVRK